MNFSEFNLNQEILESLGYMGFLTATPVQSEAIPKILEGNDIIACAQTGTGKTGAYLIPMMHKILASDRKGLKALVIVPTRELASQIDQQIMGIGYNAGISSLPVYGGNNADNFVAEQKALEQGCDIVVATPGRLIAHIKNNKVNFEHLEFLVLDEADKMLEMGFVDDIMYIQKLLPLRKQSMMFSATMPQRIMQLARKILVAPEEVAIAISKMAKGIDQNVYLVHDGKKTDLLEEILKNEAIDNMIIFASSKDSVNNIEKSIKKMGLDARSIHSGREQEEREKTLQDFKNKTFKILVATNVLSRGIDIEGISHILNFDAPKDAEDYVHRAGRTARADKTGKAITLVNEKDRRNLYQIESLTGASINIIPNPESIGPGPEYNPEFYANSKGGGKRRPNNRKGGGGKKNFKPRRKD